MNKSRGRPRGNPPTKARLVEAAREQFLEHGYRRATVRGIAARAGVDSALVSYHFGSKRGLFGESMRLQVSPAAALAAAIEGDPAGLPDRILRAVTGLWDDPELSGPLAALVRMAVQDEDVMQAFQEYMEREVVGQFAEYLGGPDASARASAAVSLIAGLILTRYLVPLQPTSAYTSAEVRRVLGPALAVALRVPPPRRR